MIAPRIEIDLDLITHNTRCLVDRLGTRGIEVCGVTKATCGSVAVARAMMAGGVTSLGDARVPNLERLSGAAVPRWLIRSPMLSQIEAVIATCTGSFVSDLAIIDALGRAATATGRVHQVMLMVDLGDLREGWPVGEMIDAAVRAEATSGVDLQGIGTNMGCFAGIAPTPAAMAQLAGLADAIEQRLGRGLALVSGGNSANLRWATEAPQIGRVNHLRLGESILLGRETLDGTLVPDLRPDAFHVVAEVIESRAKPSAPHGRSGRNAFGAVPSFRDQGVVERVVLALGRQDVRIEGLTPEVATQHVLGGTSDHLVVATPGASPSVGAEVRFLPDYGALLAAMTSPYVHKPSTSAGAGTLGILGILGGLGPHAHVAFERMLLDRCAAEQDQDYPDWVVVSCPSVPDRTDALLGVGPSPVPALRRGMERLARLCDFAVIPCNTAHAFLAELGSPVPIIDLIQAAVQALPPRLTIGLLGSTGTLISRLFQRADPDHRWLTLLDLPEGEALHEALVMRPVYGPRGEDGRRRGGLKSGSRSDPVHGRTHVDALSEAVERLIDAGAQRVIAGCTEIPLLVPRSAFVVDPMWEAAGVVLHRLGRPLRPGT